MCSFHHGYVCANMYIDLFQVYFYLFVHTIVLPVFQSIDKCDNKKKRINISSLKVNKDYFVSCNDIRVFIQKNGLSSNMDSSYDSSTVDAHRNGGNFGSPEETETIEAVVETTPIEDDKAAAYIVQHWEEYSKTTYAWPILWTRLERLGWRHRSTQLFMAAEFVYVPSWAIDGKFVLTS